MEMGRERQVIADLRFPLLSDKTGRIARDYGVLLEDEGMALRGLFLVDPEGVTQYGGLCGSDWKPGQAMAG